MLEAISGGGDRSFGNVTPSPRAPGSSPGARISRSIPERVASNNGSPCSRRTRLAALAALPTDNTGPCPREHSAGEPR